MKIEQIILDLTPKQQLIIDCLKENKTWRMTAKVLKRKCVKKDWMMEYDFPYDIMYLLAQRIILIDRNRKLYIPKED